MLEKKIKSLIKDLEKDMENLPYPWDRVDCISTFLEEARSVSPTDSLKWIEKGVDIASAVGYERAVFSLLTHKAYVLLLQGEINGADYALEQSRNLFPGDGLWPKEAAYYYHCRGVLELNIGLPKTSLSSFEKAAQLAKKEGCLQLLASAFNNIGLQHMEDDNYSLAEDSFLKALEADDSEEGSIELIRICNNLGMLFCRTGETSRALHFLERGREQGEAAGNKPLLASLAHNTALIYKAQNKRTVTDEWFRKALFNIEDIDHISQKILIDFGRFLIEASGTEQEGVSIFNNLIPFLKSQGANTNLLEVYRTLLDFFEKKGKDKETLRLYHEVIELEKEQYKQQLAVNSRQIRREMIIDQHTHLETLMTAGRKILSLLTAKEVIEAFRTSMDFILSSEALLIAERVENSRDILVDFHFGNGHYQEKGTIDIESSQSFIAYSLRKKKEIVIRDLENEAKLFLEKITLINNENVDYKIRSLACIPFTRERKECVLSIQNSQRDFFTKDKIDFLKGMTTFLATALDNAEKNKKITKLSTLDSLTNLYNRRHFLKQAERCWASHHRSNSTLGIAIMDLDHFKSINDRYGHRAGDFCLVQFSHLLKKIIRRKTDIYGRYGGEEFILIMGYSGFSDMIKIIEKIRHETEGLIVDTDEHKIQFTVSIGLAFHIPEESKTMDEVIEEADRALYKAKAEGRNRVVINKTLTPNIV